MPITNEALFAFVENLLRTIPSFADFETQSHYSIEWIGQACAAIERWDRQKSAEVFATRSDLQDDNPYRIHSGWNGIRTLLQQARADLALQLEYTSAVVPAGKVFSYFDEIRKIVEGAQSELFFVDPYLDAEFVSRYLEFAKDGVAIRLLGGKKLATLLPAVDMFAKQRGLAVAVRASDTIHDRYVFVDKASCFQSGASFKDGAKNAPAVIAQVTDAFQAMWETYEGAWNSARVER